MNRSFTLAAMISADSPLAQLPKDVILPAEDMWSDEPPLESDRHREQMDLLVRLLRWWWRDRKDFYVTGNLTVYYSPQQKKSEDFRGPDFFVVLGTQKKERKSWVVWHEGGKYPDVVIELLSDSTAEVDRGIKKQIYQDIWRVLDYFWFDPQSLEFQGFHLIDGAYEDLVPNAEGWLWSSQLGLFLGLHDRQLRFFSPIGQLVPLEEEAIGYQLEQTTGQLQQTSEQLQQANQQLEDTSQALTQERLRAERLAAHLRSLGIDPVNL